jgi:hypothetical protein
MNSSYEQIYGVGLLDDLHNYFPALLYDSSTFVSVPDVLSYVQSETRRRFDLFSVGASRYYTSQPLRPARVWPRPQNPLAATRPRPAAAATTTSPAGRGYLNSLFPITHTPLHIQTALDDTTILQILLRSLATEGFTADQMSPVVVRPTEAEVAASTTDAPHDSVEVYNCAICQDGIVNREISRKINHCGHKFHINCIDVWFQQNVRCPVCRHDIRTSPARTATS